MALVVSPQMAVAVEMIPNSPVSTPGPSSSTVQAVVEPIAAPQMPVAANLVPSSPIKALVGSEPILVTSDTLVTVGPEPARALVVVVFPPQMPIGANLAPMPLVVAEESAQAVLVMSNAFVVSPSPLVFAMEAMIVVISPVQSPVPSHDHPFASRPSLEHAQAV
jgi:hypothetical protein